MDELAVNQSILRGRRVRMRRDLWGGDGKGDFECESRPGLPLGEGNHRAGNESRRQTSELVGVKE